MSRRVPLERIAAYLDERLELAAVPDYPAALNGLQVENAGHVGHIVAAVDASAATIEAAAAAGADFLLVHHGLFWDGAAPVVGRRYRKLRRLIERDIALYAAHLPLDAHPELGNNALLLRALGLEPVGRFGTYDAHPIGWWGETDRSRDAVVAAVRAAVGGEIFVMPFGPARVRRLGVVTGGAGSMIAEAHAAGLDAFVTGEGAHHTYFDAQELGITVVYAGHYATETYGVRAAAQDVAQHFDLPWSFVELPTGL